MKERNPYQLPADVEPLHYDLLLRPDFTNFTFSGTGTVLVRVKKPVSKLTLHCLDLQLKKAAIRSPRDGDRREAVPRHTEINEKLAVAILERAGKRVGDAISR